MALVGFAALSQSASGEADDGLAVSMSLLRLLEYDRVLEDRAASISSLATRHFAIRNPDLDEAALARIDGMVYRYFLGIAPEYYAFVAGALSRAFTLQEQREILAFHRTEAGRKMRELLPKMLDENMRQLMQDALDGTLPDREPVRSESTRALLQALRIERDFYEAGAAATENFIEGKRESDPEFGEEEADRIRENAAKDLRRSFAVLQEKADSFLTQNFEPEELLIVLAYARTPTARKMGESLAGLDGEIQSWMLDLSERGRFVDLARQIREAIEASSESRDP